MANSNRFECFSKLRLSLKPSLNSNLKFKTSPAFRHSQGQTGNLAPVLSVSQSLTINLRLSSKPSLKCKLKLQTSPGCRHSQGQTGKSVDIFISIEWCVLGCSEIQLRWPSENLQCKNAQNCPKYWSFEHHSSNASQISKLNLKLNLIKAWLETLLKT